MNTKPVTNSGGKIKIYGIELRNFSGGMYPIGRFFHGICKASPHGGGSIPSRWEGHRSSVRPLLMSSVEKADIRFEDSALTGSHNLTGNPYSAFEQRRDFERALWDFVSGYNVVSPGKRLGELSYVRVQKTSPAVRLQQGQDERSPEVVFTSNNPGSGTSLDVTLIRTNHNWPEVENWIEGQETDAILKTSNFLDALPYAVLFEDLGPGNLQGTFGEAPGNFAFFWSTDPSDRAIQIIKLLQGKTLKNISNDPFFRALIGDLSTINEINLFSILRNPVFCVLNIVK